MASDTIKKFEGSMTTTETALQDNSVDYTPASGRKLIIQGFWICNTNTSEKYGNLKIGSTLLVGNMPIPALDTLRDFDMNCPLFSGEKIYVKGEVGTDLKYRIWGIEVDA